jgi:hypothetical protein
MTSNLNKNDHKAQNERNLAEFLTAVLADMRASNADSTVADTNKMLPRSCDGACQNRCCR